MLINRNVLTSLRMPPNRFISLIQYDLECYFPLVRLISQLDPRPRLLLSMGLHPARLLYKQTRALLLAHTSKPLPCDLRNRRYHLACSTGYWRRESSCAGEIRSGYYNRYTYQ
jgi:hypothetical protein